MDHAHGRDGELDLTGLDGDEGGVSGEARGYELDAPDREHAVGGPGRLLGVERQVGEEVGLSG